MQSVDKEFAERRRASRACAQGAVQELAALISKRPGHAHYIIRRNVQRFLADRDRFQSILDYLVDLTGPLVEDRRIPSPHSKEHPDLPINIKDALELVSGVAANLHPGPRRMRATRVISRLLKLMFASSDAPLRELSELAVGFTFDDASRTLVLKMLIRTATPARIERFLPVQEEWWLETFETIAADLSSRQRIAVRREMRALRRTSLSGKITGFAGMVLQMLDPRPT